VSITEHRAVRRRKVHLRAKGRHRGGAVCHIRAISGRGQAAGLVDEVAEDALQSQRFGGEGAGGRAEIGKAPKRKLHGAVRDGQRLSLRFPTFLPPGSASAFYLSAFCSVQSSNVRLGLVPAGVVSFQATMETGLKSGPGHSHLQ